MMKNLIIKLIKLFFNNKREKVKGINIGFIKSPKDKRDHSILVSSIESDKDINLIRVNERSKFQGKLPFCYAFGIADWYEHEIKGLIDVSEMFISYKTREHYNSIGKSSLGFKDTIGETTGAVLRDVFKILKKDEIITDERFHKYIINNFNLKPDNFASMYAHLLTDRVKEYWRVYTKDEITECLSQGHRIVLGMRLDSAFIRGRKKVVDAINVADAKYGHCMSLYGQEGDYYLIKNWWSGYPTFLKIKKSVVLNSKILIEMWSGKILR